MGMLDQYEECLRDQDTEMDRAGLSSEQRKEYSAGAWPMRNSNYYPYECALILLEYWNYRIDNQDTETRMGDWNRSCSGGIVWW